MRKIVRLSLTALLVSLALGPAPAGQALVETHEVSMDNSAFNPATVTLGVGAMVRWTNDDAMNHTATSNNGFFNTGTIGPGMTDTVQFASAGKFGYHCNLHVGMNGIVRVKLRKEGSPSAGWTIIWSTYDTVPDNRGFDVLIKRPGDSSFEAFRTNTQRKQASFNPPADGTYLFKARTDNRNNGQSSGWSPKLSVSIS